MSYVIPSWMAGEPRGARVLRENYINTADLIFKKAFGIETSPVESFMWLLELGDAAFRVEGSGLSFTISRGSVGVDNKEKLAIGLFKLLRMQETVKRYAKGVPGDPWRGGG